MRFDYLTRFEPLYTGGLRTLARPRGRLHRRQDRHSANETGPGHSVILTGRHPSRSGIVANDWFDAMLGKPVNVVDDARYEPLGGAGRKASPAHMAADTVGDLLKARNPRSRVVGVSLKDRSAILMGGRRADAAYWYETSGGNFITSTYYMRDAPRWLTDWNQRHLANGYAGRMWTRLLPDAEAYERYVGQDAIEGEWDRKDTVFPHAIRGRPPQVGFYDDLRRTPFADDITLSFALEAMRAYQLGEDEEIDLFAIGFSATDVVGHTYGPESHEIMDQLLRLDATLADSSRQSTRTSDWPEPSWCLRPITECSRSSRTCNPRGWMRARTTPAFLRRAVEEALAARFPGVRNLIQILLRAGPVSEPGNNAATRPPAKGRRGGGSQGIAGDRFRRQGLHTRRLETRRAVLRRIPPPVSEFVLRVSKPTSERPAETVGLRQHAARRDRPRHRLRTRQACADRFHGTPDQRRTIHEAGGP